MGDEVIQLPKAPVVVSEGKVIAPATGYLVDLTHDFAGCSAGGGTPCQFAHPVAQRLLSRRARFRVHLWRSLLRLLPAEGKTQELKAACAALEYSGLVFIQGQPSAL